MGVVRHPNKGDKSSDRPIIVAKRKREKKSGRKEGRMERMEYCGSPVRAQSPEINTLQHSLKVQFFIFFHRW